MYWLDNNRVEVLWYYVNESFVSYSRLLKTCAQLYMCVIIIYIHGQFSILGLTVHTN